MRIMAILRKELRQLSRDRLTGGMIVGMPLLQLILFGYAINTDVRDLRTGVVDMSGTQLSRQVTADLAVSQVMDLVMQAETPEQLTAALRRGEISLGVFLPRDFDRRVIQRDRPAGQILVDGTDPTITSVANQLRQFPIRFDSQARPGGSAGPAASFEVRTYFNPERRSAVNVVPGLLGTILTMTMVMFTAVAIVREKERGNMELLITTPISRGELMVGKILPYILIGLVQVALILAVARWVFQVPFVGSLLDIYLAAMLFILANLTLGLMISTFVGTQFQAMQLAFFVFLPSILLSGFMFPFDGMPRLAQWIAEILPLTHFLRLVRGVMLRGAELSELGPDLLALAAFAAVTLTLAILRFSKRLD